MHISSLINSKKDESKIHKLEQDIQRIDLEILNHDTSIRSNQEEKEKIEVEKLKHVKEIQRCDDVLKILGQEIETEQLERNRKKQKKDTFLQLKNTF